MYDVNEKFKSICMFFVYNCFCVSNWLSYVVSKKFNGRSRVRFSVLRRWFYTFFKESYTRTKQLSSVLKFFFNDSLAKMNPWKYYNLYKSVYSGKTRIDQFIEGSFKLYLHNNKPNLHNLEWKTAFIFNNGNLSLFRTWKNNSWNSTKWMNIDFKNTGG